MTHSVQNCLDEFETLRDEARAKGLQDSFGEGEYFGVSPQALENLARTLRQEISIADRIVLSQSLWEQGAHEAKILAAKLFTAARIKDDDVIWQKLTSWLDEEKNWAILDALCAAGARRLISDLTRIQWVEERAYSEDAMHRRIVINLTAILAKQTHPNEQEQIALDQACDWLPVFLEDTRNDVRRSAETWMRSLKKHHFKKARMIRQIVAERSGA